MRKEVMVEERLKRARREIDAALKQSAQRQRAIRVLKAALKRRGVNPIAVLRGTAR